MDISSLVSIHETFNKLGWSVFEQFVTLAEAGDSDSMLAEEEAGNLNRNAVRMIDGALESLFALAHGNDDELAAELSDLKAEVTAFLAAEPNDDDDDEVR